MAEQTNPTPPPEPKGTDRNKLLLAVAAGLLVGVGLGTMMTVLRQMVKGGQPCAGCAERAANDAVAEARIRQMLMGQDTPPEPPAASQAPQAPTWAEARPSDAKAAADASD